MTFSVAEAAGAVMLEPLTVMVAPGSPDDGLLVMIFGLPVEVVLEVVFPWTRKELPASKSGLVPPLTPLIWTHAVYVVPTEGPEDGQLKVALEKLPFDMVGFEPGPTVVNGVQLEAVL